MGILEQSGFPDSQLDTERATVWNYSFPLIVDCQNLPLANSYYGLSDIEDDIIDLNQSVFIASNIRRIIRFTHPKTWGTGISAKEVNTSPDSLLILILMHKSATLRNARRLI